jgi:C4-type Zn-finger protein
MASFRTLKPDYRGTMKYENEILHDCPVCKSNLWNIKVTFEDYEIATYILDMECSICGTFAKAPTPLDKP